MASDEIERFARLAHELEPQAKLRRVWQLQGGVSAQVTALELEWPDGRSEKRVVRRHGAADRAQNAEIAADEFKLLQHLHAAGLATPKPYLLDRAGAFFDTPCLVIEYVDGQPEFAPTDIADCMLQLATHLASIHRIDYVNNQLIFLPQYVERCAKHLQPQVAGYDEALNISRIRATLASLWPLPQHNRSVLLHGDFWPGNTLWKSGRLVAVIDWEDAGLGDPLADVASARLELLWAFGSDAMASFTQQYQAQTALDWAMLPHWDLWAALRLGVAMAGWGLDQPVEQARRVTYRWFVAHAFEALATGSKPSQ